MIVVARAVHVGGHGGNKVGAVLAVIGIAQPNARDLGNGIRLIRRLQRPGQHRFLFDRLFGQLGIDATRSQKQQFFDAVFVGGMDHIQLNHEIFVDELFAIIVVGICC